MSKPLRGLVAALLLMAAFAPAASAQYFGQNKVQYEPRQWKSITSDHFDVYFYGSLDSLAMRVLDLAEKTNQVLSKRMGHQLGRRVPIILYGSHNDFAQTNVTPELIDAGTGGFTEVLRNRVVLPFTGSYEDLRHVVVHELTHAFMFDMLYGGSAAALLARQSFFSVPLWFAEGMAEYFSLGMESNAEIFLRDGTVEGYLPPLAYSGGYIVYKQGQSAITYLCQRFGEERLRDILRRIRQTRNFEHAFQRSVGSTAGKFDEQWRAWLRKQYWPTVARKEAPEEFARRLTDHTRDESNLNTAPSISPQGDRIAFFSDRRQYTDVYLMSALDGKIQRRVIRGERDVHFESIPLLRSSITWSPDGRHLALTAKSRGRDVLYVIEADRGRIERRIELPCEALSYPSWSPVSDSLVVVGVRGGRSDLWLVEASGGTPRRLTDDTWDEREPSWSPDGRGITFSSDRLAPVVLHPVRQEREFGRYGLFHLDLASGATSLLIDTSGEDRAPTWSPDGRELAFISDLRGAPNVFLFSLGDSTVTQLTDVLGGVQSLSWSRQNDRLVFSAYNRGGFDVFAVREPLSVGGVLSRLQQRVPEAVMTLAEARSASADSVRVPAPVAALTRTWQDSTIALVDSARVAALDDAPRFERGGHADTLRLDRPLAGDDPRWTGGDARPFPSLPDTVKPLAEKVPLVDRGGPFALPDSLLGQKPSAYRPRLAPDYGGAGFYAASGYGVVGSTQFVFSDFLGDHNVYVATDIFSSSIEETNALAIYNYLPRRWDFGVGVFHFKDYFDSRVSTFGESFGSPRLFSERNFGALVSATYPFDRFRRAEFGFTQMFVQLDFFAEDPFFGGFTRTGSEYRSVSSPSVSLVGDNTLFGYYGPVNGRRYNLSYSPSFAWFQNGLAYQTYTLDARRYWDMTHGYTFAARTIGGFSQGRNAQSFRIGGFSTLRGFPDFELLGSRVAILNTEVRFPFIQQLGLVGPLPIGLLNLRGAIFADAGAVWNEGEKLRLSQKVDGQRRLLDPRIGPGVGLAFGTGIRTALSFLILKLDVAWRTDLADISRPRWHFSLGPEF
jgi:Tol biopolymer transport system component